MEHAKKRKCLAFMMVLAMVLTSFGTREILTKNVSAKTKATLTLSKTKASIKVGGKTTLKLKKKNIKKVKSQTWSSSKKSVASVSKKGVVKGKKAGKATIKAVVKYVIKGEKKVRKKTLKCKVTVKQKKTESSEDQGGLHIKWNDTSNIGPERVLTLTDTTMKVKDNGSMRKNLSAQYLADNEMGEGINLGNTIEAVYGLADKKALLNGGSVAFYSDEINDPQSSLYVTIQGFNELFKQDTDTKKTVAKEEGEVPVFSDVKLKVTDTTKDSPVLYDDNISWNEGSDGDCRLEIFRGLSEKEKADGKKLETLMPDELKNLSFTELKITFTVSNIENALKKIGRDKVSARIVGRTDKVAFQSKGSEGAAITKDGTYTVKCSTPIKCTPEDTQFDQGWSVEPTTQEYLDRVHSYGFNTLRIPVAWTNGDCDDGTYTIDTRLLDRVERVANYALNNGMYVIINDHWDNGWWAGFGACKKIDKLDENGNPVMKNGKVQQERVPDEELRAKAWQRYERYWTQIAERFKNYSDHIIFEGANEELCNRLNDSIYPSTGYCVSLSENEKNVSGNLKEAECYEMTNKINQKFVDIIRGTGGNNAYRHLLIPGYATDIDDTCSDEWKMPSDTVENGKNKLFLSVHYYTPWGFCGDKATGEYTQTDRNKMKTAFEPLKKFTEDGYAVITGECGICNPTGVKGDVIQWFRDTLTEAVKYHMVPCMWETGQFFDRKAATLKFKDVGEFFNEICGTAGDTSMTRTTGYVEIKSVDISGMKPVWSFEGRWYKNGGDFLVGDDKFKDPEHAVKIDASSAVASDFATGTIVAEDGAGETEIIFDNAGYQSYINIDRDTIKDPIVYVTFLAGTEIDDQGEDSVGMMQIGAAKEAGVFKEDAKVAADEVRKGGIRLKDIGSLYLLDSDPWLCLTFTQKPIVTGIYIYDGSK